MPTYVYETLTEPTERFEVQQSMKDDALTVHPENGVPVRRVISGGYGLMGVSAPAAATTGGARGCGSGCGCH